MTRLARVIAVGAPHHITQRGNARRFILQDESDRKVYLDLLRQSTEFHGIAVVGYCLMSNHVHVIAVPRKGDVLARALKETHGRFGGRRGTDGTDPKEKRWCEAEVEGFR